jgi:hypothetical protein
MRCGGGGDGGGRGGAAEEEAGTEGVEVRGQVELEVECEEEAQLQRVELGQRNAPDLRPARKLVS